MVTPLLLEQYQALLDKRNSAIYLLGMSDLRLCKMAKINAPESLMSKERRILGKRQQTASDWDKKLEMFVIEHPDVEKTWLDIKERAENVEIKVKYL